MKLATYSAKGVEYSFRLADPGDSSSIVKFYASMDPETIHVKLATYSAKGVEYSFRLADPGDSSSIVKFYASMDPETIFMRFLSAYGNFEGHVRGIFPPANPLGFVLLGEVGDAIVVEGESFLDGRRCAELAPVVHPSHRSRGLGSVITALMVVESVRRGAICIEVYYHVENTPMARIAKSLGMKLSVVEEVMHGVVGAEDGMARAADILRRRNVALAADISGTASSAPSTRGAP